MPETAGKGFTCTANICFDGKEIEATVERDGPDLCAFEIKKPQQLAGVKIAYNGKQTQITYRGISFDYAPDSLPDTAFSTVLNHVFNALTRQSDIKVSVKKTGISVSGNIEGGSFTAQFNRKTQAIESISFQNGKLTATFSGITYQT